MFVIKLNCVIGTYCVMGDFDFNLIWCVGNVDVLS